MPRLPCRVPAILALAILFGLGAVPASFAQAPDAKSAETKPAEAKPAEPKKDEPKKDDAKPADAKSTETKPADTKPAETKPAEAAKPSETKPTEPKSQTGAADAAKDPFGEELNLVARNVVIAKGSANWDTAFETITKTLKAALASLEKAGGKLAGSVMVVYTSTEDTGFTFDIALPVDEVPANLPKDLSKGLSTAGKALKFVHRGSYDNMDNTYEAITNHLDDKKLEAQDSFIEEYVTDPLKTAEDKMVINVLVPLKTP